MTRLTLTSDYVVLGSIRISTSPKRQEPEVLSTFAGGSQTPADPGVQKIRGFRDLRAGWHYGEGAPIADHVVRMAEQVYRTGRAMGLQANAFPGFEGDVAVAFYRQNRCLEVVLAADGTAEVNVEAGYGLNFVRQSLLCVWLNKSQRLLGNLYDFAGVTEWSLHAYSAPGTLTTPEVGSRMWHSSVPPAPTLRLLMGGTESPSLKPAVPVPT